MTPGLIDCHTHLVYAGQRAAEFARRTAGSSYGDIAREGGGILITVRATRAASVANCVRQSAAAPALAARGRRDDDRDQVRLRAHFHSERSMLLAARELERNSPGHRVDHVARPRMRCRPSSRAAPTTTSTPSARTGYRGSSASDAREAAGRECRRMVRRHRLHRRRSAIGCSRRGSELGLPRTAARRAAGKHRRQSHGRTAPRAVRRPPRTHERAGRRAALAHGGHRGRAAARSRSTRWPKRSCHRSRLLRQHGVPIAVASDCQSRLRAGRVVAARDEHGAAPVRSHGRGGAARRNAATPRAPSAWTADARHDRRSASAADFAVWSIATLDELGYWIGFNPCSMVVRNGAARSCSNDRYKPARGPPRRLTKVRLRTRPWRGAAMASEIPD